MQLVGMLSWSSIFWFSQGVPLWDCSMPGRYEFRELSALSLVFLWFIVSKNHQNVYNVLPLGWDKHSYGYHGDDGHSFCSSGTGQPYGPTFTTGDVIGCCVNLINNTCFYTKNGHSLGSKHLNCTLRSNACLNPNFGYLFFIYHWSSIQGAL